MITRPWPISVTVAALVMGVLITAMAIVAMPMVVRYARHGFSEPPPPVVARLTSTRDAVWTQGQVGTRMGSHLVAGHSMSLVRGLAEVTFDDGAVVWLEGPCQFQVTSTNAAALQRGKLSARISESASGFTVTTPVADIVDIGTAFGVRATAGATEVQVFVGAAEVRIAENQQRRTLRAGESLQVRSGGKITPSAGDMRIALPGFFVPLGNLLDDDKQTPLRRAIATDQFAATAEASDLGVKLVQGGTAETVVALHDAIRFDLGNLGWSAESYTPPTNDAFMPNGTGISTTANKAVENRRYEEGIGMHANQLLTFDVDEIRRAGEFSLASPVRLAIARMGMNQGSMGLPAESSLHLVVIVSSDTEVLAGWINGQNVSVERDADHWRFAGEIPPYLKHDSQAPSLDEVLPSTARYITLVCTGAGVNAINSDHGVFSPCMLEIIPEPPAQETKAAPASGTPSNKVKPE